MMNLKEGQLFVDIPDQRVEGKLTELELMQAIVALESIAMADYNIPSDQLETRKFIVALMATAKFSILI